MRIKVRRGIALAVALVVTAACGPFHRGAEPESVVVFHNESTDQADVYALAAGGDPTRIGTVFPGKTETLRVPQTITGGANRLNVIARIFPGGRVVSSGPFSIYPGDTMVVTLSSDEKILSVLPVGDRTVALPNASVAFHPREVGLDVRAHAVWAHTVAELCVAGDVRLDGEPVVLVVADLSAIRADWQNAP